MPAIAEWPETGTTIFMLPAPLYALLMSICTALPVYLGVTAYDAAASQGSPVVTARQATRSAAVRCPLRDGESSTGFALPDWRDPPPAKAVNRSACNPESQAYAAY